MAMVKCIECGKDISDKAALCPHCGIAFQPQPLTKTFSASVQISPGHGSGHNLRKSVSWLCVCLGLQPYFSR